MLNQYLLIRWQMAWRIKKADRHASFLLWEARRGKKWKSGMEICHTDLDTGLLHANKCNVLCIMFYFFKGHLHFSRVERGMYVGWIWCCWAELQNSGEERLGVR